MEYYRKAEVAAKGRMHPVSVMRLVKQGVLPQPIKLTPGSPCLFPKDEVDKVFAEREASRDLGGHNDEA